MLTDSRIIELRRTNRPRAEDWNKHWADSVAFARAIEREARREALEDARRACERNASLYPSNGVGWESSVECAAAIRALIDREGA